MDITLLKTFLEIQRTRHFGRAADNLYVSQSAVSARIRQLEDVLGVALFTRARNDIQLTAAGQRLLPHAESMLNIWNQACHAIAVEGEDKQTLVIGAGYSLWDVWLGGWLDQICQQLPQVVLHAEACGAETLVRRVRDASLDIGFLFEPPQTVELESRQVAAIKLVLVASQPNLDAITAMRDGYIMVDWGAGFSAAHARHFPDMGPPALRLARGNLALRMLEGRGGAAYLDAAAAKTAIQAKRLHLVKGAPEIERPVYALYRSASLQAGLVKEVIDLIGNGKKRQRGASRATKAALMKSA